MCDEFSKKQSVYQVHFCVVDALTLYATTRLTNIQFTADLHNTSSQAYENLTESIREEVGMSFHRLIVRWELCSVVSFIHLSFFLTAGSLPLSPTDLPVSVCRDEGHDGFWPGENGHKKLFTGECRGQFHHRLRLQSKPRHWSYVQSSAGLPDEQHQVQSGPKQHKHKWYVSLHFTF